MTIEKIRVLVVDDSKLCSEMLTQIINSDPDMEVIGVAHNGLEAVDLAARFKPNLITMDLKMPKMDGYEAVKQIMAYNATPIIIITASYVKTDSVKAFHAISIGALDIIDKAVLDAWSDPARAGEIRDFVATLKFLSKVKVISHITGRMENVRIKKPVCTSKLGKIVGIVASTGGPQALMGILNKIPANLPAPILIVQHITSGFETGLAEWLGGSCKAKIVIPADGEQLKPSVVYIAPNGLHMTVDNTGKIKLVDGPAVSGLKPSGTILLESLANVYGNCAIGVVLTGMGSDGAIGLKAIKDAGGFTIAQNEATSVVFGMPQVSIQMNAADEVLPLDAIADEIMRRLVQEGK